MKNSWKKLSTEILFKNKWWSYYRDYFKLALKNKIQKNEYHYVHTNGSSLIIPVKSDGKIILVKQFRYLNNMFSVEFPCGGIKTGQTANTTALIELQEETKFKTDKLKLIGKFNPYNGVTDEICSVFLATKLTPSFMQHDDTEEFEILEYYPEEINSLIYNGQIWDGMTIAAWGIAQKYF